MYSLSVVAYENADIPKIHLTAEEPPMDPTTNEYSERETQMYDHQCQISISDTGKRGPVYVNTVISYLLSYDAAYVMDNDNLATALSAQVQISIALIDTVRKLAVEPIVLAKK